MNSPYTISSPQITNGGYVTTAIADYTWSTTTAMLTPSGQIELKGDQADLVINGVSLSQTLNNIQKQLCMLLPNPALEAEWLQLQDLGDQYRRLEAELLEKQRAWEILKKQG